MLALIALTTTASSQQESKNFYSFTGNEATITGTIHFEGEAPEPREIDMAVDEACMRSHQDPKTEDVSVNNGRLANVLLYVKSSALENYIFETPSSPVMIERQGCQIIPHVLGIQTGQTFLVFNSSTTIHNTNVQPKVNKPWNVAQGVGGLPIERKFEQPEPLVIVKDNQHPWEKAYLGVFSHPFFNVTEADGTYTIRGLPAGKYKLVAWHEKFGVQTVEIVVAAKEMKNVDFNFTIAK